MQPTQFKSDHVNTTLNLNSAKVETPVTQADTTIVLPLDLHDPSFNDSLSVNYISPDSTIIFGFRPEWSQFRKEYVPKFDYRNELTAQLPYDSLHTVLKGVEVSFTGKKISRSNPDWLIGVLIFTFILLASVRLIFNKYLRQLLSATINYSMFSRMLRERFFNLMHASFRLDLIFNLSFALFGYQLLSFFNINFGFLEKYQLYVACFVMVISYFVAKRFVYYLIGILTESRHEVTEYLFNITLYNRVLGLFLFPISALITFLPTDKILPVLFIGLGIIVIFYSLSLIRGAKIFLKKQFPILYLILYLCTLEILPLLLIYNLLFN